MPAEARAYLKSASFSDAEIAAVEGGSVVSRIVPLEEDNDVFIVGVVRIAAPAEALVAALQKIETLRNRSPIVQIGRFSTPPRIEDLDALTFETKDLEALRACRVGDCDIKVGTPAMEAARRVDWKASDAHPRASRVLKDLIVARVARYPQDGPSAMAVYNDNEIPESTAIEVAKIVDSEPTPLEFPPDLLRHVLDFPMSALPDVESFVYWSKEKTRKTVVSVAHVSIETIPRETRPAYAVAMKHLYDSHYFLAKWSSSPSFPRPPTRPPSPASTSCEPVYTPAVVPRHAPRQDARRHPRSHRHRPPGDPQPYREREPPLADRDAVAHP